MKTFKATTARILILCLLLIGQNVAEPTAHQNVVSHHQKKHHNPPPSGIQTPHQQPSTSKVSCISADSNIYEILHKANANCKGNDFKCTFYHYSDHEYHNLGTIEVNKDLFDTLLAKYDNWLITPEPININSENANHKVRLKDTDNIHDKYNQNRHNNNVMHDTNALEENKNIENTVSTHYRRHKTKFTGDQKARYKNGELVAIDPKFNDKDKYYEIFLPKDKHKGDPRTIYVEVDGNKSNDGFFDEKLNKELNNDLNDKPIKVQLGENSTNEEKFAIYDKYNRKDIYRHHSGTSDNNIARAEDNGDIEVKESCQKYLNPKPNIIEINNNQAETRNNPSAVTLDTNHEIHTYHENYTEDEDDDDKSHRIHLVETNKHHNDLNADNFTYKRSDTIQLNEPVFHVEKPHKENNMHIFSLPDYTGYHSDGISDYIGYKDIHHLSPLLHDDHDHPDHDVSMSDKAPLLEKESPVVYTNPNLQAVNDEVLPGQVSYYTPKATTNTPFSLQDESSPIVSSSFETAIPNVSSKYSPYNVGLRSSPFSRVPETISPCELNSLLQGTISSSPPLSNEGNSKINLLSLPLDATKPFEVSNSFKRLPSVSPETTFSTRPCPFDATPPSSIDITSSLNNLPKSLETMSSNPALAAIPSPMSLKLGADTYKSLQMPYSSPYTQFSTPNMNLGLLNHLPQRNNFAKPVYNQNNIFSQPPQNIFGYNPYLTRPQSLYPCAEPANPKTSYLSAAGSAMNSSPLSAYNAYSLINGKNRLPGTVSNAFLPVSPVNPISPLSLMLQRPNYITPASPYVNPASMTPCGNIPPLNQDILLDKYHQVADNLAVNSNLQGVANSLSPLKNIPLSVLEHPYTMSPSNYIRPTPSEICSTLTPTQAKPIISQFEPPPTILNALEREHLETSSSYSELAHLNEKPCLNLQNEPLVPMLDDSLIGEHLPGLSPNKPIVCNADLINDESLHTDFTELNLDSSLVDSDLDTTHIKINTTVSISEIQPEVHIDINQDSNLMLDSSLTEPCADIVPSDDVSNNKTSIKVTTTINIESQPTLDNEVVIPELDNSLIGEDLPMSSADNTIVTEVENYTKELNEASSLKDLTPLEQSHDYVELTKLSQSENLTDEISTQSDIEYCKIDESVTSLPSNLIGKGLEVEPDMANLEPLDSSLVDSELDYVTESVDHEFEALTPLDDLVNKNINIKDFEHDVLPSEIIPTSLNLSVQANIDLKPEAENKQLLEEPTETTINVHTTININENNPDILESELTEGEKITLTDTAEESITTNEETEFVPLEETTLDVETIPTKDNETTNEFKAEEFIPTITSGMNIPTEIDDIQNILPANELNSSLIEPNLELTEESDIVPADVNFTSDLVDHPSLIKEIESPVLSSDNVVEVENSLIGPSLIKENNILETTPVLDAENVTDSILEVQDLPEEDFQEILPISESPINVESNLTGPSLLENLPVLEPNAVLESSLVDPGVDQIINAPEMVNNTNFSSNLLGPSLVEDVNEIELVPVSESGVKLNDVLTGPSLVNETDLVEDSVLDYENQLDSSIIGPDLTRKAELKEVKPEFDQTNSVSLDSSLIDNLLDSEKRLSEPTSPALPSSIVSSADILPTNLRSEGIPLKSGILPICPNSPIIPEYTRPNDLLPYTPEALSFSHDLIGPGLSEIQPTNNYQDKPLTPLPNSYIPPEAMPVPSNSFLEELKPIRYSKLPDLHLPATHFKNAPQYSLPCENLFAPSPLTSFPPSVLNLPANMLSQPSSPLYANAIPYSHLSLPKPPLHNIPNIPLSKLEYLQSIRNPLVLNALLNNPHLKDAILSSYTPHQEPLLPPHYLPYEQIASSLLPKRNLQNLPYNYLQALNGIPFNLQPLKSTIPCVPQTINKLSLPQMNLQEAEILSAANVQNTPALPTFNPVKSQVPFSSTFSPLQTEESESLFNYENIETELNSFINEAENDSQFLNNLKNPNEENYESLEETSVKPCEEVGKYQTLPEHEVEKYISGASSFAKPLNVAKEQLNLQETEYIKPEPELNVPIGKVIDLPRNPSPKYRPKAKEQVCYEPLIEDNIPSKYQFLKPSDVQITKPSVPQGKLPKLPSTEQFYSHPYEMLPEPMALPMPRPISSSYSSPLSYAKPTAASYLSPCGTPSFLQEYTSLPASEILPTTDRPRSIPTGVPCRPSKTCASPYLPDYSSRSFIETNGIPIEAIEASKIAVPCKPCQSYASPYLPMHSSAPLFESSVPISPSFSQSESKELPIVTAALKPLPSSSLSPAEYMAPPYYSPVSPTYRDSSLISSASLLPEPSKLSSATSGLPCLKSLPETHPILRELLSNPQFMKAMNIQPIANNIYPYSNAYGKLPTSPLTLQTPSYPIKSIPYETLPVNMEKLKENELSETLIELNPQKPGTAALTEVWTTYDEEKSYTTYSNDSGKKIHEDIIPENHLESLSYTLEPEEITNLEKNDDLTSIPLQTQSYAIQPLSIAPQSSIKTDSLKKNEFSESILELNSQKLKTTAPTEVWTTYNEENTYTTYSNDSGKKIHEDKIPENHLTTVSHTLEPEEITNLQKNEDLTSIPLEKLSYATQPLSLAPQSSIKIDSLKKNEFSESILELNSQKLKTAAPTEVWTTYDEEKSYTTYSNDSGKKIHEDIIPESHLETISYTLEPEEITNLEKNEDLTSIPLEKLSYATQPLSVAPQSSPIKMDSLKKNELSEAIIELKSQKLKTAAPTEVWTTYDDEKTYTSYSNDSGKKVHEDIIPSHLESLSYTLEPEEITDLEKNEDLTSIPLEKLSYATQPLSVAPQNSIKMDSLMKTELSEALIELNSQKPKTAAPTEVWTTYDEESTFTSYSNDSGKKIHENIIPESLSYTLEPEEITNLEKTEDLTSMPLETLNYSTHTPEPLSVPAQSSMKMDSLKKNKLSEALIELNSQKPKTAAPTEVWTTYNEENTYTSYSNDSGKKIHEDIIPESHLETISYTLEPEEITNLEKNEDLTSIPLQTQSYATQPLSVAPQSSIKIDSFKKNEHLEPVIESNLQKLETTPSEIWTTYDEKSNYFYSNDSGKKIHENIVPESYLESVPYTLEPEENANLVVKEDLAIPLESIVAPQSAPIKIDSLRKNELSGALIELNSQKLKTATPTEVWTTYDEEKTYISYSNDSGKKVHEDIIPSHSETLSYTLELEQITNLEKNEDLTSIPLEKLSYSTQESKPQAAPQNSPIKMDSLKKNELSEATLELNSQKIETAAPTEIWTTYDEKSNYFYSNDSGKKIHEDIVPESHLESLSYTLEPEKITNLEKNEDLTSIPLEKLSYSTQESKPPAALQNSQIKMDSLKKNELSEATLELNSQKLETAAPTEVWTTYDEKSNYFYSNDNGKKIHEDVLPESHLESVSFTLESEDLVVHETPISSYATEPTSQLKLNQGRPISYSQVKEPDSYQPSLEAVPQTSDMQWLPLSSTGDSSISLPSSSSSLSKPCQKLTPFIPSLSQSPNLQIIPSSYLQPISHFPSFLPSPIKGKVTPCKNKLDSLMGLMSAPYHPAILDEYSGIPITAPYRNYTPLLPINSNVIENLLPLDPVPYVPTAASPQFSPYTRLPSYLPSPFSNTKYQSNIIPLHSLQLQSPTPEQLQNLSPMTAGLPLKEYMPVQSPIYTSPLQKAIKTLSSPHITSTLPIQNGLPLEAPCLKLPGLSYPPKYQNIIENLPIPVSPLKEPLVYEPAPSSPSLSNSPKYSNIIENVPLTVLPSSDDMIRTASNNLSPSKYAPYTSSLEEYIGAKPCLPCRYVMKPIFPQNVLKPMPQLPVDEYIIPSSSSYTKPIETYNTYETKPICGQYVSKPSPKLKPDLAKYLPLDANPCQIIDQPYMPTNKVQTPNVKYISESSPLLKQLLATPLTGDHSLPFGTNVKPHRFPQNYLNMRPMNSANPSIINPFIKSEFKDFFTTPSYSVPTNVITPSTPIESNTLSATSSPLDNYEEYFEPCSSSTPLKSLSLLKPLMTSSKVTPQELQETPIELQNILSSNTNIPQYISPNSPLLEHLYTNAYNPPLFNPQNNFKGRPVTPEIGLSKHQPITCNVDETMSSNAPILSEMVAPSEPFKASMFNPYQCLIPTEKISPISMTPLSSIESPLFTSPYQEISPSGIVQPLPDARPSSVFSPPCRHSKLIPIPTQYGPKSIVGNARDIENICPGKMPSYSEATIVEPSPKPNNIKQIHMDGFPISELFTKATNFSPYISPSNEVPKTPKYQNSLPNEQMPWVLINNENIVDEKNAELTSESLSPCEYVTQRSDNPIEAEYLKLAKLLSDSNTPKSEFEKYTVLSKESEYEELPSNLQEDNTISKNVFKKSENIALNLPQKPNFYVNNHIGKSPLVCFIDPTRKTIPMKSLTNAKQPYNEITPDITTNFDKIPSSNIELASELPTDFIRPKEYLRSANTPTEGSPISLDTKYLERPSFKSPKIENLLLPVEYLPESQYYYPPKDNKENIKYSGYKTYQIPTLKLAEKSPNIPSEMYYRTVPLSPVSVPKPSLPYSYIPTINPESVTPEYETLESPFQPNSDLRVQPQSPNYNVIDEIPVKTDNFDGDNEIKNSVINYINNKGLKDKLYTNNNEITIPLGDIAITKREPHIAKVVQTNNPSIGLKVWKSNVKLVKAELKLKFDEVSVNNFMPIVNNLNEYDVKEIRKIIKDYIDEKYGQHVEVNEPYTVDNQYTVVKDLNHKVEDDKFNLLWPTHYV